MNAATPQRLGILGGTFDPIHLGHLVIAEEARISLSLDRVLVIPARVSPFKLGQTTASANDRLRMVELAIADNPAFQASRLEIDRPGPSYTVDTLRQLHTLYGPRTELYLLLGTDSLAAIAGWHQAQELTNLSRIAVYARSGSLLDLTELDRQIPGIATVTTILDAVKLDISSTEIRSRTHARRTIRYLVPAAVEAYIHQHHLYLAEGTEAVRNTPTHTCL